MRGTKNIYFPTWISWRRGKRDPLMATCTALTRINRCYENGSPSARASVRRSDSCFMILSAMLGERGDLDNGERVHVQFFFAKSRINGKV